MPEVVGAFLSTELWHERANCSVERGDRSRGNFPQHGFGFAARQLDRVEVRRVLRLNSEVSPRAFSIASRKPATKWTRQVSITTIVAPECGNQALLDIGAEHPSGHGTLNHHWRGHLIVAQGAHEGECLPCAERNGPPWSPPPEPHHVGANRSLVDKHQPCGIKHALLSHPASAGAGDSARCRSAACRLFFKGDAVSRKKNAKARSCWFESAA